MPRAMRDGTSTRKRPTVPAAERFVHQIENDERVSHLDSNTAGSAVAMPVDLESIDAQFTSLLWPSGLDEAERMAATGLFDEPRCDLPENEEGWE